MVRFSSAVSSWFGSHWTGQELSANRSLTRTWDQLAGHQRQSVRDGSKRSDIEWELGTTFREEEECSAAHGATHS